MSTVRVTKFEFAKLYGSVHRFLVEQNMLNTDDPEEVKKIINETIENNCPFNIIRARKLTDERTSVVVKLDDLI